MARLSATATVKRLQQTTGRVPVDDGGDRRVTTANLGAWVLKGNADRADLAARFALDPHVTRWCVQPSYRTRLMRAGQPVLFWASGSSRRDLPYGIWGCGRLTGPAELDPEDFRWRACLDLTISPPDGWVSRTSLRCDAALADLEVLRQPQAANPSFVTHPQFAVIQAYLSDQRCRPAPPPRPGAPSASAPPR
jgi:hypothetical protein